MKDKFNEVTGRWEKEFNAELLSVSEEVKTMKNEKQTEFRNATIRFEDVQGNEQQVRAIIYNKNYSRGMETGKKYLTTASPTEEGGPFIVMSHLAYSEEANSDMFDDFKSEEPFKEVEKTQESATSFEKRD